MSCERTMIATALKLFSDGFLSVQPLLQKQECVHAIASNTFCCLCTQLHLVRMRQ